MMRRYAVRLRHDGGTVRLVIAARCMDEAAERVCAIEGAPRSAVLSVRVLP
jgi:hypothetical protein